MTTHFDIKKMIRLLQEGEDLQHLKEHQEALGGEEKKFSERRIQETICGLGLIASSSMAKASPTSCRTQLPLTRLAGP